MNIELNENIISEAFPADEFRRNIGIESLLNSKKELVELAHLMLEDVFIQIGAESESFVKTLIKDEHEVVPMEFSPIAKYEDIYKVGIENYSTFSINLTPPLIRSLRAIDGDIEISDLKLITRAKGLNVLVDFIESSLFHYGYKTNVDSNLIMKVAVKNRIAESTYNCPNPFE